MLTKDVMKNSALTPIIVVDQNYVVTTYNQVAENSIGHKLKMGMNIKDVFDFWDINQEVNIFMAKLDEKKFTFLIHKDAVANGLFLVGINEEKSNHLIKENVKLRSLNKELMAAIENSYDAIYITDRHGVTLFTNSAIEKISGIPKEYYIGKKVDSLVERGILKSSITHPVVKQRRSVSIVQKNYEGKEILLTGTPLFDEDGEVKKVITNIRDLSALNELQSELRKVRKLNEEYRRELSSLKESEYLIQGAIVKSEQMKRLYETAERIANIDATVLITGETGVGKDVLARYIFEKSTRSESGDYVKINCGAIPEDLLESELFGYEPGAFTGASSQGKVGLFAIADNGVLFLDEIGELPLDLQVKLLRVLQEGEIQRVGGVKTKKVDVRIIAATNRNLEEMTKSGTFREDLYYRLNVIPLTVPPLKNRRDDILPLMEFFLNKANKKYNMEKAFSSDLIQHFYSYDWPGNVRELANLIERLVVTTLEDEISSQDLMEENMGKETIGSNRANDQLLDSPTPLKEAIELTEKRVLSLAAEQCKSTYEVAKMLEVSQPTVVRRFKKYGIDFKT